MTRHLPERTGVDNNLTHTLKSLCVYKRSVFLPAPLETWYEKNVPHDGGKFLRCQRDFTTRTSVSAVLQSRPSPLFCPYPSPVTATGGLQVQRNPRIPDTQSPKSRPCDTSVFQEKVGTLVL